jgi:glycogen synthase
VPLLVYPGLVQGGRGIETLLAVLSQMSDVHLALVGPGGIADKFDITLALLESADQSVKSRIHIVPMQESDCLPRFLSTANAGVFLPAADTLNLRVTGPNKFFEMLLAGLPLVVSDVGLMGDIIREHHAGICVEPGSAEAATVALQEILANEHLYRATGAELHALRERYSWEAQEKELTRAYLLPQ